jgi:hypothetical protein
MLLFHEAVGGSRYTFLKDEPLSFLDLSHLLTEDRCMLVGKVPENCFELDIDLRGGPAEARTSPRGQRTTLIRIVMPVKASRSQWRSY